MRYTYFASFVCRTMSEEQKYGNTIFDLTNRMKGTKELELVTNSLKEQYNAKELIVLNFQLINEWED